MNTTRRDFVVAAVTAAGATATPDLAHADTHGTRLFPRMSLCASNRSNLCWSKKSSLIGRRSML
jgi:hypothetical protein